jgi:hypothetical protein
MEYLFIIYSCKQNAEKSELLYKFVNNKIFAKCYIMYGDENLTTDYEIKDDKYFVLKCGDNYENLSCKTIMLFHSIAIAFPNVKGVFKCDDDILPNKKLLFQTYEYIETNNPSYLGKLNEIKNSFYSDDYYNKMSKDKYKKPLLVRSCKYAAGPLYYLNMETILIFNKIPVLKEILNDPVDYMFEDNMVGFLLSQENIFLTPYETIYNDIIYNFFNKTSIQNINNQVKTIFIKLGGGLGNQLFQVSFAYELAKQKNMHIVLVYDHGVMTHNTKVDEFLSNIFYSFNSIHMYDIDYSKVITYYEDKCFNYNDNIIQNHSHYFVEGYFQNKKYLKHYRKEVIELFRNPIANINNNLITNFPLLNESYFLHVRRGDYVTAPMYHYDMDSYFSSAIEYIIDRENPNIHFYIFSDDIHFCKNYHILNKIANKTFIENMNTLNSLYLMSLCKKGGICSNSTFSGWASTLNTNPDKICIVPKQWINIDYPYEIPFEYTISF